MAVATDKRKFVTCAGCVVYRHDPMLRVLLIKPRHDLDSWGVPKGHCEKDETLIDCAIREVFEETGFACMPSQTLQPVWTYNPREIKHVHIFLARHMGDVITPNPVTVDEVADIQWFDVDSLPPLHRYQIPMMDEALSILRSR